MDDRTRGRSSGEIRREIDETRADIDRTVKALERKFTPGRALDDIMNRVRGGEGGLGDVAGSLGDTVRNHPVPLAMMGLGLGWLAVEKATGSGSESGDRVGTGTTERAPGRVGPYRGGRLKGGTKERLTAAAGQVSEKASEAARRARETGERARETGRRAKEAGEHTRERVAQARDGAASFLREQPLAAGAISFVTGLAAGLVAPSTRLEDRAMGRTAEAVKDEARTLAKEAGEGAREVATEAAETAVEATKERDMGDEPARKAGEVVSETTEAARRRAEEEGLTPERMRRRAQRAAHRPRRGSQREPDREAD